MQDIPYHEAILSSSNLPILCNGLAAVSLLIAQASTTNTADNMTVADAAFLMADIAKLVQEVAERNELTVEDVNPALREWEQRLKEDGGDTPDTHARWCFTEGFAAASRALERKSTAAMPPQDWI